MGQFVDSEFQNLLHNVIEYEDTEQYLAADDEEIPGGDVTNQLYSADLVGWNCSTGSWKFNHQSEERRKLLFIVL